MFYDLLKIQIRLLAHNSALRRTCRIQAAAMEQKRRERTGLKDFAEEKTT